MTKVMKGQDLIVGMDKITTKPKTQPAPEPKKETTKPKVSQPVTPKKTPKTDLAHVFGV